MVLDRRRFVACVGSASSAATVFLSGCSDPVSEATLEATDVVSVRREEGWSTEFVARFGMTGLSENEGVFGVSVYLLGSGDETLHEEELGDYVWSELPQEEKEIVERDVTFYEGSAEQELSAETDGFPFWLGFEVNDFRLTRSAPEINGMAYRGGSEDEMPESEAEPDDWEKVPADELPSRPNGERD